MKTFLAILFLLCILMSYLTRNDKANADTETIWDWLGMTDYSKRNKNK